MIWGRGIMNIYYNILHNIFTFKIKKKKSLERMIQRPENLQKPDFYFLTRRNGTMSCCPLPEPNPAQGEKKVVE